MTHWSEGESSSLKTHFEGADFSGNLEKNKKVQSFSFSEDFILVRMAVGSGVCPGNIECEVGTRHG